MSFFQNLVSKISVVVLVFSFFSLGFNPTSINAQTANPCLTNQFLLEYFNGTNLQGNVLGSRCEDKIDFNQAPNTAPSNQIWPPYNWSVRFSGGINFASGRYRFTLRTDDGSRLFINGEKVLDAWFDQDGSIIHTTEVDLNTGINNIRLDYYQTGGGSVAKLEWEKIAEIAPVAPCPLNQFFTQYYDRTKELNNTPVLERCETTINNYYPNMVAPIPQITLPNRFSIRWDGNFEFTPGTYLFTMTSDDGSRLFIDNTLVAGRWINQAPTTFTYSTNLSGFHKVKMEYQQDGGNGEARLNWVKVN
jgi:PA14 domain